MRWSSSDMRWSIARDVHLKFFFKKTFTLPETNIATEMGWLEYDRFLLGRLGLFSVDMSVFGGVYKETQFVSGSIVFAAAVWAVCGSSIYHYDTTASIEVSTASEEASGGKSRSVAGSEIWAPPQKNHQNQTVFLAEFFDTQTEGLGKYIHVYMYIHIHIHTHIHSMYIYTYICIFMWFARSASNNNWVSMES